jgi:DNA-binding XRE family transcriptional regulator
MSALATPLIAWSRAFPASPPQIREARRFLATILDGCPAADDALLCLSELATNALVHSRSRESGGCFTIHAQRQGSQVRVEVRDQGGPWTPPALTDPGEQNGRGLAIVSQLARAWGRSGDEAGWTVWFEIGQGPGQRWVTLLDGHRLQRLRRRHGLTQAELAAKAGLSSATVARLERGTCLACRCRTVARLAAALDTEPTTLMSHPPPHQQTAMPGAALSTWSAR